MGAMKKEIWKDIVEYEGHYQVSNLGRVRRLKGVIYYEATARANPFYKKVNSRILSTVYSPYACVSLCKSGVSKNKNIHSLVAIAFLPNPENKPQVNHIDGNKRNCCVDNLEWCTSAENFAHAIKIGLHKKYPHTGHAHSDKTKKLFSQQRKGRAVSEDAKEKIRKTLTGRPCNNNRPIVYINKVTNKKIRFRDRKSAALALKIDKSTINNHLLHGQINKIYKLQYENAK